MSPATLPVGRFVVFVLALILVGTLAVLAVDSVAAAIWPNPCPDKTNCSYSRD